MCMTYDADLDEFEQRITELQKSPTDELKRYAVCEQSRFVLDAVEQAVTDYDGFVNESRRDRALSLFDLATLVLSNMEDRFYTHVLGRVTRARKRLGVASAA